MIDPDDLRDAEIFDSMLSQQFDCLPDREDAWPDESDLEVTC